MVRSPRLIVAARVLAGLNQAELAEAAGIPRSVLQALEQGRTDPRNSTLLAVLDALSKRGVRLLLENERVAWGVYVERGSEAAGPVPMRPGTDVEDEAGPERQDGDRARSRTSPTKDRTAPRKGKGVMP